MRNTLFTCSVCKNIFRSRHDLNNHVKSDHQSSVKVKFQNGEMTKVKRTDDNGFQCGCGKSFKLPNSLRRHAKKCNGELAELKEEKGGAESMNVNDFDASEFMDVDDRVVPGDCLGALLSHKSCL